MLFLKEVNLDDAKKQYNFLQEMPEENGFLNKYLGISFEKFLNEDLPALFKDSKGIDLILGRVPQTYFFLWYNDTIVGLFKVRHYLNDFLKNGSGHIGFGIHPNHRNKGYATKGLKLAIEKLKSFDDFIEDEVYLSCNITNTGSLKTMLNNGGYIHHSDDKNHYVRIAVNSYL